jgi:tRNA threonylcarbamoyladenosine biosynthesis protein TsaE
MILPIITQRWLTAQAQDTKALGAWLGHKAQPGDILACCGVLGAGKTTFVQGFADGLGIGTEQYVRSPTFTLIQEYQGRLPLYHFDLYRLSDISEVYDLGFIDYLAAAGVVVVEWADKFPALFTAPHLEVNIQVTASDSRSILCTAYGIPYVHYFHQEPSRLRNG